MCYNDGLGRTSLTWSVQLIVPHVRSCWYNPPRRRRHLMKEVLQWHILFDMMQQDVAQYEPPVCFHVTCG